MPSFVGVPAARALAYSDESRSSRSPRLSDTARSVRTCTTTIAGFGALARATAACPGAIRAELAPARLHFKNGRRGRKRRAISAGAAATPALARLADLERVIACVEDSVRVTIDAAATALARWHRSEGDGRSALNQPLERETGAIVSQELAVREQEPGTSGVGDEVAVAQLCLPAEQFEPLALRASQALGHRDLLWCRC